MGRWSVTPLLLHRSASPFPAPLLFLEQIQIDLFHLANLVPSGKTPADYLLAALDLCL